MTEGYPTETQWRAVYDARERLFATHFGPIPADVQKLMNLTGVWPGGCLVQIPAPHLGGWMSGSFGLTNCDMPAQFRTQDYHSELDDQARPAHWSMRIAEREPREVPAGLAGYGYELLLFTPEQEFWPLMFLNWAVPGEILEDIDLLGRVQEADALTIEDVSLGDDLSSDFLVARPHSVLPETMELPNGTMHLLVATAITRPEMEFALRHGKEALLDHLLATPLKQMSRLRRESVV